jgi:protein TonB
MWNCRGRREAWFAASCLLVVSGGAIAGTPEGARPLGNPGEWITTEDYPQSALLDDTQGTVAFHLTVDRQGRVQNCEIIQSSGSDQLDATACNLITQRARFSPARDARGRPVEGGYSNRVRWVLPKEVPQPHPRTIEGTFVVDENGDATDCRLVKAEGFPDSQIAKLRTPCVSHFHTTPFVDDNGKPVRRLVRVRNTVTIEPAP